MVFPVRLLLLSLAANAASMHAASAQVKPAPAVQPVPAAVAPAVPPADARPEAAVTVVGSRPSNRVDRQVYDVKNDPAASNDTAADALNKVPSVAVDPDGTVTLRGSQNVQILIDGKPSAMLQGENRGAALNALPAGDIDSIEVINTPGAKFGNESGGGPILNIVTRRTRRAGGFAVMNANAGNAGRYNAAVNGNYNTGRWGMQGSAHVRHDGRGSTSQVDRTRIHPVTAVAGRSTQSSVSDGMNDMAGVSGSLTYNLTDKDTLGANGSYSRRSNDARAQDRYVNYGQDDIADSDYQRATLRSGDGDSTSLGARWDHKGAMPGEVFKADLRVSSSDNRSDSAYVNSYLLRPPGISDSRSRQASMTSNRIADLTGDYERPGDSGTLELGFKLSDTDNLFDTRFASIDPASGTETVNPARTNRFALEQQTVALYGSYEWRPAERWGILGGLRAEHTRTGVDQQTSAIRADHRDTSYIPSFYINYSLSKDTDIRLNYARRLRRPSAGELNPFVVYRDEYNVSSGNPQLAPEKSDALDLGLETKFGKLDTNLRAYYSHDSGEISERRYFISDTVLLTTRDNTGSSQAGGLEFTVGGKLLPWLTINTSGNLAYFEQRVWNDKLGGDDRRSVTSLSGRARFNFQLSKQGSLQLMVSAQGRNLIAQGYRAPHTSLTVNYRRVLTPALSLVMNVNDVFNSTRSDSVIDTGLLRETSVRRSDGRIMYIGLSYRLGGFAPAPVAGGGKL